MSEQEPYEEGKKSAECGGTWWSNPYPLCTTKWFAFEDGRRDGEAKDVGPEEGTPTWA